jgi:hypothetical protein
MARFHKHSPTQCLFTTPPGTVGSMSKNSFFLRLHLLACCGQAIRKSNASYHASNLSTDVPKRLRLLDSKMSLSKPFSVAGSALYKVFPFLRNVPESVVASPRLLRHSTLLPGKAGHTHKKSLNWSLLHLPLSYRGESQKWHKENKKGITKPVITSASGGYLLPCPSTRSGKSQSVEETVLRSLRINCSLTTVPGPFFHVTKTHRRQEGTTLSAQSVVYPERANICLGGPKSPTRASRRTGRTAPPTPASNSMSFHTPPTSASNSMSLNRPTHISQYLKIFSPHHPKVRSNRRSL